MEWIKEKLEYLGCIYDEYPKVYWCSMLYMVLAGATVIGYFPLLVGVANLSILNGQPFQQMITENLSWLRWGIIVIPVLILFFGWCHADDLYHKLRNKRYGY